MAMNMIAGVPLVLGKGVEEFVKAKGIEEGFATLCQLARECYAGVLGLETKLVDDPDVDERQYVVVRTIVPENYPIEQGVAEMQCCNRMAVERIPWSARMH